MSNVTSKKEAIAWGKTWLGEFKGDTGLTSIEKWRAVYDGAVYRFGKDVAGEWSEWREIKFDRWTLDELTESASAFRTPTAWLKAQPCAYAAAQRRGILKEICAHMSRKRMKWTFDECLADARKYSTAVEWRKAGGGAYNAARVNKWLAACTSHMKELLKPRGYWTLERCRDAAARYHNASEWIANDSKSYSMAYKNGWLKECSVGFTPQRLPKGHWNFENVAFSAASYSSKKEWAKASPGSYDAACLNGWVGMVAGHMDALRQSRTLEQCKASAAYFQTRGEWKKNDQKSYNAASRNAWLEECCKHMGPPKNKKKETA